MYFLIDIGATNMRLASSKDLKNLEQVIIFPTPKQFMIGLLEIKKAKEKLFGDQRVNATSVGIAGPLNSSKTKLIWNAHKDWVGKDIYRGIKNITGSKVFLENDSSLAGLGEAVLGAGKNHKIVAYITLSSGVGGVRIINGKMDNGHFGFEPGSQLLNQNHQLIPWQFLVGGRYIKKLTGLNPHEIKSQKFWDNYINLLLPGIHNIMALWSPEVLVIGGGIEENQFSLDELRNRLKKYSKFLPGRTKIVKAKLGTLNVLVGGMIYIKQQD